MGKSLDTRFHFLPSNFGITCLRNHYRTICVIIVKNITFERFPFLKPKAASEHITHWQKCIYCDVSVLDLHQTNYFSPKTFNAILPSTMT